MAPVARTVTVASGGRFVPPLTVARSGLGLSAGQYKITDYNAGYSYALTGANTTRASDIVSLNATTATGTVQAVNPKGVYSSSVVNVSRQPYAYYTYAVTTPYCATHWNSGQCAGWGGHTAHYGPYKYGTGPYPASYPVPANQTDSEGEWWRIW